MEFRLVLRQTCGRHVHGVYDIYSSGQVRTLNVYSFFWRLIQEDDSAINISKYSGSCQLTYFRKFYWNSLTVIDFNSQQTKLLSQNATFNFFFDPVGFHFWK